MEFGLTPIIDKLRTGTLGISLILLLLSGCGKERLAEAERRERGTTLYRRAMTAEQAGNTTEAIRLFNKVLIEEPRSFSAHFQLATLLQDHAEDYLSAIFHYRQYLMMRPESDKNTLANDRIRVAEQMLAPQILKRVGDSVEGITQAHLLKENDRLNRLLTTLEGEKATLLELGVQNGREIERLKGDNQRLREFLRKARLDESALSEGESAREAATAARSGGEVSEGHRLDGKSIKELREEADAMAREGSRGGSRRAVVDIPSSDKMMRRVEQKVGSGMPPPTVESTPTPSTAPEGREISVMSLFGRDKREKKSDGDTPKRTYVVQPGDTLSRIAARFYGDSTKWKVIREANRTNIDPDGRVRAGQIIVVP